MRRLSALALVALSLTGCCRRCSSPVDPNKTVYLRGSADPEIREVMMDDQWGTEDRTVPVKDGSYAFAWLGKDLTAALGGERSFVVRAPSGPASGAAHIVSSEFCLRGDVTLNLFLWKPQVSATTTPTGILEIAYAPPPDEVRYQRISRYDVVLEFQKTETKLDGSRATTTEKATHSGNRIPANVLKGRSSEAIHVTVEALGEGSPSLRYVAPRASTRATVSPESSLTMRGTVGANVTAVEVRSARGQGRRTSTVTNGRFEWTWTGIDIEDLLGAEDVIFTATGRTGAKAETDPTPLRELLEIPYLEIWKPRLVANLLQDGKLDIRVEDAVGPPMDGRALRVGYFRNAERSYVEFPFNPGASGSLPSNLPELLEGRTHEEIELQMVGNSKAGPKFRYSSAPLRVSVPLKKRP